MLYAPHVLENVGTDVDHRGRFVLRVFPVDIIDIYRYTPAVTLCFTKALRRILLFFFSFQTIDSWGCQNASAITPTDYFSLVPCDGSGGSGSCGSCGGSGRAATVKTVAMVAAVATVESVAAVATVEAVEAVAAVAAGWGLY